MQPQFFTVHRTVDASVEAAEIGCPVSTFFKAEILSTHDDELGTFAFAIFKLHERSIARPRRKSVSTHPQEYKELKKWHLECQ
jgi:hypothetical protein